MANRSKRKNENEESEKATNNNQEKKIGNCDTKEEEGSEKNAPLYGTKEYWENRYKSHIVTSSSVVQNDDPLDKEKKRQKTCIRSDDNDDKLSNTEKEEEHETLPGHVWYFTYDDLRPLLLPLVLGRDDSDSSDSEDDDEETEYIDLSYDDDDDEDDEIIETNDDNDDEDKMKLESNESFEKAVSDDILDKTRKHISQLNSSKKELDSNNHQSNNKNNANATDDDNDDEDYNNFEENKDATIEGGNANNKEVDSKETLKTANLLDDDNNINTYETKFKMEKNISPKRVLEIGCGDVPLGMDFCNDLLDMQKQTGSNAKSIVSQIVCCDFSETVIQMLKERQQLDLSNDKSNANDTSSTCNNNDEDDDNKTSLTSTLDVQYIVADARNLEYDNEFFDVIIDKGTLDAMLSDKEHGVSNCRAIVAEVARVLSIGGYFMLISHLNANTQSGLDWLDEVLASGLQTGGGNNSKWLVECHGGEMNDEKEESTMDEEENINEKEDNPNENTSPGPAVYIICKLPLNPSSKNDGDENKSINDPIDNKQKEKNHAASSKNEENHKPTISLKFFTY